MKSLKNVLKVMLGLLIIVFIGYFIFTANKV